ncbi:hypothetical protein [Vibrio splendidus]|uniref:hypothetical protein n=1 Tax=Vibrio splendidus TaxID=29497 RepID=UPI000318608E|nr:hypothetical protein [Vibrio splendidus]KPL97359.1 hypothetical protein AN167_23050 [Vibrio splendidus]MDH6026444.1 hypothetical protein [Vibrio splendidus]MDP2591254.1 hypothetical protein [Vibrio splendidus]OEE55115.1 hypothetical protein A146_18900 [Vibrio splendidus FF-500]PMJ60286.1 hypothetical protein BCU23_21160 [Vibrio splendidus]
MYKYLTLIVLLLAGCVSTNEVADKSWCQLYNDQLTEVFSNELTLGARALDTVIGCAPRPLPKFVQGDVLTNSTLMSDFQVKQVTDIKEVYANTKPNADDIINFVISPQAKQLALSRALRLNELSYSIIAQSQKDKSEIIKNNTFEILNEFTEDNIDKLNKAVKEASYDRYQKQVHRIQRDYYDILYQITLGGADKDGRQSISYDPKDIATLLTKAVKVYADQQAIRSNFLLMRDQYFATINSNSLPSFDQQWENQITDIKEQCELTAKGLGLDETKCDVMSK